jgi:molybdopterin-guanine dinucleotide biosynthesis protein A
MPTFSAVLLAGGQSRRMGRDKALLPLPGSGILLWQRQLHMLEELKPDEIFWSGPARPHLPAHVRPLSDEIENAGPLSGISAGLNALQSELLIVLAIDLPRMNAAFLRGLVAQCSHPCGAVVRRKDFFEPLAAVYPKGLHVLAAEHLRQKHYALQDFIREAVRQELLAAVTIDASDGTLFKNVNSPADLEELREAYTHNRPSS